MAAAIIAVAAIFLPPAAVDAQAPAGRPAWITLGTGGGPLARMNRAMASNALVVGRDVILFDAGDGLVRRLAASSIGLDQVRAVVLSHLHPDHTAGLAALIALRWQTNVGSPLIVYGPIGTAELVRHILESNRPAERIGFATSGSPMQSAARSVEAREIACKGESTQVGSADVIAVGNSHYVLPDGREPTDARSCSFRISVGGGTVFYTGDTGPSPAVTALARRAGLLVSEVIDLQATLKAVAAGSPGMSAPMRQGLTYHLGTHHLTPEEVGRMASQADVGRVVLTHVAPGADGETDMSGYTEGVRRFYHGSVTVATDGERFDIPHDR